MNRVLNYIKDNFGEDFGLLLLVRFDEDKDAYHFVSYFFENGISVEHYDSYADDYYLKEEFHDKMFNMIEDISEIDVKFK